MLLLRSAAIAIQFVLILVAHFGLQLHVPLLPLLIVVGLESVFQLASVYAFLKVHRPSALAMFMQLVADVIFLTILLSLTGGATNAFVSLLLLSIMIAAVTVPARYVAAVALLAIGAYSGLMFYVPAQHHAMNMHNHFVAMWINFVISAVIVAVIITALARAISQQQKAIARSREEQLSAEQLVALGSAAAQVTHQLATPLANLQLLHEELQEQQPTNEVLAHMAQPLAQCQQQLHQFRATAEQLRLNQLGKVQNHGIVLATLIEKIKQTMSLQFPEQTLSLRGEAQTLGVKVSDDPLLIAAILNLLANAALANQSAKQHIITLSYAVSGRDLLLHIDDQGGGISEEKLLNLGTKAVKSEQGMGLAVWLSNATVERLGGTLRLSNYQGGARATLTLKTH